MGGGVQRVPEARRICVSAGEIEARPKTGIPVSGEAETARFSACRSRRPNSEQLGDGFGIEHSGGGGAVEGDRAAAVGREGDRGLALGVDDHKVVGIDALVVGGDATAGDEGDDGEEEGGAEEAVLVLESGEAGVGGHGWERIARVEREGSSMGGRIANTMRG